MVGHGDLVRVRVRVRVRARVRVRVRDRARVRVHGNHFNTPQRLLPFLKMMCNDVIKQCQKSCDSGSIFEASSPTPHHA